MPSILLAALDPFMLLGCLALGGAVGVAALWVLRTMATEDLQQENEWRYDVSRINELRRGDTMFRIFQWPIQRLAKLNRVAFREQIPEMQREIQAAGLSRY